MGKTEAINIAKKYGAAIRSKYKIKRIFLFGSFAKGNTRRDSDIDIAIILDDFPNLLEIQLELMRLTRGIDTRIEPHPIREKDFTLANPLFNEIMNYGEQIIIK